MERYFELRENNEMKNGIIYNIPSDLNEDEIINRIEVRDNFDQELILVDKKIDDRYIDIEMDWIEIDFEGGIDQDLIIVDEILDKSRDLSIEDKVVFSALSKMKQNASQSISDVMLNSFDELKQKYINKIYKYINKIT